MATPTGQWNTLRFEHARGQRYGEIFVITHDATGIRGAIYNSMGLNDVPRAQWEALDPAVLKKEYHADAIVLNGPRLGVMDTLTIEVPNADDVATFGGIQMRLVGMLRIPDPRALGASRQPYTEHTIERTTTYEFAAGKLVYEPVAAGGEVYIMQTFSHIVDSTLTEDQLATLASRLRLPAGWRYLARTLDQDLTMRATSVAHVIQDELQNTYQRVDR
jgi:hypothetical protein